MFICIKLIAFLTHTLGSTSLKGKRLLFLCLFVLCRQTHTHKWYIYTPSFIFYHTNQHNLAKLQITQQGVSNYFQSLCWIIKIFTCIKRTRLYEIRFLFTYMNKEKYFSCSCLCEWQLSVKSGIIAKVNDKWHLTVSFHKFTSCAVRLKF